MTDTAAPARSLPAIQATVASGLGVVVAFSQAILFFAGLGPHVKLAGVDSILGVPSVAVSVVFFAVVLTASVTRLAGAEYRRPWFLGLSVVTAIGTVYQLVVVVTAVSWFSIVLVVLAAATLVLAIRGGRREAVDSSQVARGDRTIALGVFLVLAGIAGLTAAMNLTFDDVGALTVSAVPSCNFSLFVNCSKNLASAQGSLFGFPNPLIGIGAFAVPLGIGIGILFGGRFARWFWVAFAIGAVLALAFVIFLIGTSVFVLFTLCLWCALVWTFTIPMFWLVLLYALKTGNIRVGPRATKVFAGAYAWVPLITLVSYVAVALVFQAGLDVLRYL